MRFFEDGPSIPDQLLERRDQGRVVFLCGAGVSLNAGMPTFYKLTKHVVDFFDPPKDSPIESEFRRWVEDHESGEDRPKTPLDQIFNLLNQEYGREEVNALVADRLRGAGSEEKRSKEHHVIRKISADQDGRPQIVTTNFDLLFEQVVGGTESDIYEPPAFPDITLGLPITGLTYLHGRLQESSTEYHPYVLSSADFGRAYLSEGWATNFIRSLLKSYTVVLVGYQAEDPPVKYLLQGLNHDGLSDRSNLYAFDTGKPEDIEAKWRDRGVTAIACKDHPSLWRSLEAWAGRADDPRKWRSHVIEMAMKGPRQLSAHERGQVAHVVRSTPGARLFAQADPSPPAEWLCVFDAWCRVAEESSDYGEDAETFDPFDEYGLDGEPPRPSESEGQSRWVHDNIFEWRPGDSNPSNFHNLSNRQFSGFENMPPRLFHLSNWITRHLDSPITAWWAVRQRQLHPRLLEGIRRELRPNQDLHSEARRIWNLILEYQSDERNFSRGNSWFVIKNRIESEGWTPRVLRDFEAESAPILSLKRPLGIGGSKPPLGSWAETGTDKIGRLEVKFPDRHGQVLDVPDETLEPVFRIAEGHFRRFLWMLKELNTVYFWGPTCYPERQVDGKNHDGEEAFRWFLKLFYRIVSAHPKIARGFAVAWSVDEKFYFRKLKLFALNQVALFGADEAAENLLALSQECFWDTNERRELLFLICDRWKDFSEANREALAERLLNGPAKLDQWSDEEYPGIRDYRACRYTRYLTLQGGKISEKQAARLKSMIAGLTEWRDDSVSSLVEEHFVTLRSIDVDEAPDSIIDLPVNEIVERAEAEHGRDFDSYTDKRPFDGLVKVNPRKALAAVSHLARRDVYPQSSWSALIRDWPSETTSRLLCVFLHRLGRLPHETIRELRNPVGYWLQEKLLQAYNFDQTLAWTTFDHLVSGLISGEGAITNSRIGEMRRGGEVIERSRRTIEHAINSPVGEAMQGLHTVLGSLKLDQDARIPVEIKSRFEYLIAAPGEGGDHAIAILTRQISWLYYLDSAWVKDRVMPWFIFEHDSSEPAWNGYLAAARVPPEEIGTMLKPLLLDMFPVLYQWGWDEYLAKVAAQIMIGLAVHRSDKPDGLSANEARHCLRSMNDQNRQDAVFQLDRIGQGVEDGWSKHVIPFIDSVWPRERTLRTSSLVSAWISLLEHTGEKFPAVLVSVRRFLVPIEHESYGLYQFTREIGEEQPLTAVYPAEVLELIDAVIAHNAADVPYELAQILDLIEETDSNLVRDHRFLRLIDLIEQT